MSVCDFDVPVCDKDKSCTFLIRRICVVTTFCVKIMELKYFIGLSVFNSFMSICWGIKYHMISMHNTWRYAMAHCNDSEMILVADAYNLQKMDIYSLLPENDFIWINALNIEINYYNEHKEIMKLAYMPVNTKLDYYLCVDNRSGSNRRRHKKKMSWNDAHNNSQIQKCNMLSIGDNLKNTVSLLKKNTTTWVNKYTNYELPESALEQINGLSIQCVGMIKRSDGTVSLEVDDCNQTHKYICANGRDTLAPTLTRLVNTLSQYVSPIPSEVSTKDGTSILITEPNVEDNTVVFNTKISGSNTEDDGMGSGPLAGIIVGSILALLILFGIIGGLYYRNKLQHRDAYRKSLHNYRQRQNSRRGTAGSIGRDTIKSVNSNESSDKKYAQCQKDVVDECNRQKQDRYISGVISGNSKSVRNNRNNHSYLIMTGNNQVMPYEGFDPDINHLQMIHGYVNRPKTGLNGQQGNTPMTGEPPKLPKKAKKKKKSSLDDLDQYENHSKPVNNAPLHLDDLDQYENEALGNTAKNYNKSDEKSPKSLDDLDSYENYQLPKRREKGKYSIVKAGTKAVKSSVKTNESNKLSDYSMAKTFNDQESYENLDGLGNKQKKPSVQQHYNDDENYYDM